MKKQDLIARLAVVAAIALSPLPQAAFGDVFMPTIGDFATDGSVYVGNAPITQKPIYTTPEDAPDLFTWTDGQSYCSALRSSGHKDWRIPTKYELGVLYQNRMKGALKGTFNNTGGPASWYWSSEQSDGGQVWVQNLSDGTSNQGYTDDKSSLRCVR